MSHEKNPSSLLLLVTTFGILIYFYFEREPSLSDEEIVQQIESMVLPLVLEKKITFFFDADWCKGLQYDSRSVVRIVDSSGGQNCLENSESFSEVDKALFATIQDALDKISLEKFRKITLEYGPDQKQIGLGFHTDCLFCRTRYIYWPNYKDLPQGIAGEIIYSEINTNWYRIDEDWN